MLDKLFITLQKVVKDWDVFILIVAVICFPWSLVYIGFRIIQEWD